MHKYGNVDLVRETCTPGFFARIASHGTWRMAPHLALIDDVITREIKRGGGRVIVTLPPRHGKSTLISQYLPAWFLGTWPERRVVFAAYEADFAATWGRKARNVLEESGDIFGVRVDSRSAAAYRWDIARRTGGMVSAGIGGPITGRGADLMVIDDPIKNAEEAASATMRDKAWDWWQSVAYTRLEPSASVIIVVTRWHEDDLVGRLLWHAEHGDGEPWIEIKLPALSEGVDLLARRPGEALWPDRYSVADLKRIRSGLTEYFWNALYQQRPAALEGGIFRVGMMRHLQAAPPFCVDSVRAWDLAATAGRGDYTAGVRIDRTKDGRYVIVDVRRGRWSPQEVDNEIKRTAAEDGYSTRIVIEQEPGQSGVAQIAYYVRLLAGFGVFPWKPTGPKEVRWQGLAAQVEGGNVDLVLGDFNVKDFLEELRSAPNAMHDDQADAAAMAFLHLAHSDFAPPTIVEAGGVDVRKHGVQVHTLSNRKLTDRYSGMKEW